MLGAVDAVLSVVARGQVVTHIDRARGWPVMMQSARGLTGPATVLFLVVGAGRTTQVAWALALLDEIPC